MQRVRAFEADGTVHPVVPPTAEEQVVRLAQALYAAETAADEAAAAGPVAESGRAPDAQAGGADPPPHVKAVELVLHARAELEPLLDIISYLEQGKYVSIAEVQRPPTTAESQLRDLSIRHQAKLAEVRDAAALLHAASSRMQSQLQASNQFLAQAAQLQPAARLLPAPHAAVAAGAVFACDVSFPGMHVTSLADVQVLIGPNASGDVCVIGSEPRVEGVAAVLEVVKAKHKAHFQALLRQQLRDEVGALATAEEATAFTALETELRCALDLEAADAPLGRSSRGWLRLTSSLFCDVLEAATTHGPGVCNDPQRRVLPRLLPQLRHAAAARAVHEALAAACAALREGHDMGTGTPCVLRQLATAAGDTSEWHISCPGLSLVRVLLHGHAQACVEADVLLDGPTVDIAAQIGDTASALDPPPRPTVAAPTRWLGFWVADAVCVHTLLALASRPGGDAAWTGRRQVTAGRGKKRVAITGVATRAGGITWTVAWATGGDVQLASMPGDGALEKLAALLGT